MRWLWKACVANPTSRGPTKVVASGAVQFAHADLSGYSVFEEAFTWGATVGRRVAALRR